MTTDLLGPGRRCALCGRPQTPRLGGLGAHTLKIRFLRDAGVTLALPESSYAHHRCLMKVKKSLPSKESP